MMMSYGLVALCFLSSALAQSPQWGACPNIKTMPDFNFRMIQGRWFEAERYQMPTEKPIKCVRYSLLHGGGRGIIQMNSSAISGLTGNLRSGAGIKFRQPNPAMPGKLEFQLPTTNEWHNYWILGTDYHNYLVAYSCVPSGVLNLKYLWILTRDQEPSDAILDEARDVLDRKNLNKEWLSVTDQKNCVANPDLSPMANTEEVHMLW